MVMSYTATSLLDLTLNIYSSYIYFGEDKRVTAVNLPIYIGSVPTGELLSFNEKLQISLRRIVKEGIDMRRMAMVINREERQVVVINFRRIRALMGLFCRQGAN